VSSGSLGEMVTDTTISSFSSVTISNDDYQTIIKSFGSRMGVSDKIDTIGAFTRIQRGEADTNYQQKLVDEKIIDQEFVEDVLLVDFTRAVFSTDRCNLLQFAPKLAAKDATASKIRDGFVKSLKAATGLKGPAKDFLRNLEEDKDDARTTVSRFEEKCSAREGTAEVGDKEVSAVALDYLTYVLNVREKAIELQVFEFDGLSTPTTSIGKSASTRLHPETCELTTRYVSVTPAIEGEPEPEQPDQG
jgi:hypothetical protein